MSVEAIVKKDWANKVLGAETAVLVKFGADWCGPCKMIAPIIKDLNENREDVTVVEVDIDHEQNEGFAQTLGIRGVPTMVLFEKGEEKGRLVGAQTKAAIEAFVDKSL